MPVLQDHREPVPGPLQPGHPLGEGHVRAEHPGLLAGPAGQRVPADAVREAGVVPDHRAAPGLAAGDRLFQDHGAQALGRGVDRGGQAGRAGPDDDDVAVAHVLADRPAHRGDEPGAVRPDRHLAVVPDQDRKPGAVQAVLAEQAAARLAAGIGEPERHVEPGQQVPQLVPGGVLASHHAEQVEGGLGIPGPVGQALADHAVQVLLEHPGLGQVIVGLAQRHGLHDRALRGVVTVDQQDAHGQRVHLVGQPEERDPAHPAQFLAHEEQRHRHAAVGQLAQGREPGGGRRLADDAELPAEPAGQVIAQRVHRAGIAVDREQDRRRRRRLSVARWGDAHQISLGSGAQIPRS